MFSLPRTQQAMDIKINKIACKCCTMPHLDTSRDGISFCIEVWVAFKYEKAMAGPCFEEQLDVDARHCLGSSMCGTFW